MRELVRYPLLVAALVLGALLAWPRDGQAAEDNNLLQGPHPFLKDNELSVHILVGEGIGDTLSGAKLALDYGYKLTGGAAPVWLNLAINFQHGSCNASPAAANACASNTGDVVETLAGAKWKIATPIPLVPYLRANAGLVFSFPNGADDALGLAIRAAGGANYFFFDWLGLGIEVGFSVGRIDYDSTFTGGHTYAVLDFGGGIEFQF